MFYISGNTLILFKSMASCDTLSRSICCECRNLGRAKVNMWGTTIMSLILTHLKVCSSSFPIIGASG